MLIISLLKAIPSDLLEKIRRKLEEDNESYLEESRVLDNCEALKYEVDIQEDEVILTIFSGVNSEFSQDDAIRMMLELTLVWEKDKCMSEYWLGTLTYICDLDTDLDISSNSLKGLVPAFSLAKGFKGMIKEVETECNLVVTPEGVCVELNGAKKGVNPVAINEMPDNITIEYINNRYGDTPFYRKKEM